MADTDVVDIHPASECAPCSPARSVDSIGEGVSPMLSGLATGAMPRSAFARNVFRVAGIVVLVLVCRAAGPRAGFYWSQVTAHLSDHSIALLVGLLLSGGFILCKGRALLLSARNCGIQSSSLATIRIFCESALVDVISWPGKLWSDAYKYKMLGPHEPRSRIAALVLFRGASVASLGLVSALAGVVVLRHLDADHRVRILASIGVIAMASIWIVHRLRRSGSVGQFSRRLLPVVGLHMSAVAADAASAGIIAYAVCGVSPVEFAPWYVIVAVAAIASQLPAGMMVLDLGFWLVLTQVFGVSETQTVTTVVLYRALGPGFTLLAGLLSFAARCVAPRTHSAVRASPTPLDAATGTHFCG